MTLAQRLLLGVIAVASTALAVTVSNANSSLTLLYQNNLNFTDDVNHAGALLLDSMNYTTAQAACAALNEKLLPRSLPAQNASDLGFQLQYQAYASHIKSDQFWVNGGILLVNGSKVTTAAKNTSCLIASPRKLPVLCTQTQPGNDNGGFSQPPASATVIVASGDTYQGFRNQKAFWFTGVRYAAFPGRFKYSSVYKGNGSVVPAQLKGAQCLQYGSGSEDCFFLNIETPYLPQSGTKAHLRPVLFWIHGGGFTGGQGAGNGAQFATREDLVTVTINYRLSTYGFLAVPGQLPGNYGLADQVTALEWVVANIAKFGGDPNQITIAGQSAGAGSVRVMLGSPAAIGKFQGAVAMSNLGLDRALGLGSGYGTTYSSYYTINQSYVLAGQNIFKQAGCNQTDLAAQVACLTAYKGDLSAFSAVARYPVQDGHIINTEELILTSRNNNTAYVPIIFGIAHDDGASFGSYSSTCTTESQCLQANLGISAAYAQQVIDSGLFPYYSTGNVTADSFNVSAHVNTDLIFRCVDEATVYAGASSGAFPATYYYESVRAYAEEAYNPFNLNVRGTVTPQYPLGDPYTPYYKVHSSDLPNFFGALHTYRDINDLRTVQLTSGYFGSFIRSGQPNPIAAYLQARNYSSTLTAVQQTGPWEKVTAKTGPSKWLDYPALTADFVDQKQCTWLNSTVTYYLDGGI